MSLKRLCGGALLLFSICCGKGAVIEGPRDKIYYPNQGPVELTCNISEGSTGWRVNGSDRVFTITNLREGELAGHNVSGANSLLVINATNNTQYRCVSIRDAGDVDSDPAFLYIAGPPSMVGDIVIDVDTVIVNTGVNFTVNWDEPFANFDPIVNYTITINCSDASCPVMFTVAATSASVNFITDLSMITPLSVTASNTVGTSDPTTIMIAVPGNVGMINLVCIPVDLINQCTVTWNPLAVDTTLPIAYNVSYDVIANDAMSGFVLTNTSMASFDIPPVNGNVNAIVAALNALGLGPASNVAMAEIMSSSVAEIQLVATPEDATNSTYSITVNCTINPASTADMCEVMASANDQTLTGTASVANGMATVTIDGLACETMYTITAGGTLNRVLVGPRLSRGPITTGPCPPVITPTLASTTSTSVMIVTTPIPTETSGGGTAIGTTCSISFVALATLTAMVM